MFSIHVNQPSRLVVKPSAPSHHGENASTGDMVKILEKGSTIMLEPIERNSEKWFGANCYHNGMEFPVTKKPLFGPLNAISFDLYNFSFLNSFANQNISIISNEKSPYDANSNLPFESSQTSSQKDADESDLNLGSDGGTCDVSEFTSDEETVGKKRSVSVQEDEKERPKKKKLKSVDPRQSVISEDEPHLILDIDSKYKEILVEVNSKLVNELKAHQVEGIKFMYNSTIGSVGNLNKKGSGCILAHCMGSGKTLQVLTFVQTLLSNAYTKDRIETILIVVPDFKQKNWFDVFDKWITNNGLKTFEINELVSETTIPQQLRCLNSWKKKGGILIVSHSLISDLLVSRVKKISENSRCEFESYLVKPGPDMLIVDEGHLIKSATSPLSQAFAKIKTKRKIILSGAILDHNLNEYYAMVNIIKPNLLGSSSEFVTRFRNPIVKGQRTDSDEGDVKLGTQRLAVLHQLLSGRIQRFGFDTLKPYLQPKYEFSLFIRPTKLIAQMYNFYLEHSVNNLQLDKGNLDLCVNHPALHHLQNEKEKTKKKSEPKKAIVCFGANGDEAEIPASLGNLLPKNWYKKFVNYDDLENIELSCKFVLLFKILRACISVGDKLVVVSRSLETLDLIERHLKSVESIQTGDHGKRIKWKHLTNYFRIDDSTTGQERHGQLICFNDSRKKRARLLLLSARMEIGDIQLTGANRIILFDVSWNINDDIETISSVYRLGQTREVYVYRFVTKDSIEDIIFRRQALKQGSMLDEQKDDIDYGRDEFYLIRPRETYPFAHPHVPTDSLLADILLNDNEEVLEVTEFDILSENKIEEEMTEEELQEAWDGYKKECEEDNRQEPELEKEQEKCDNLREEKGKEQFENTNGPSEIEQIEEEIDVKPSTSVLLDALVTPLISSEATRAKKDPVPHCPSPSKSSEASLIQELKVFKSESICCPSSSSVSSAPPPPATPLTFSTEDCKEMDDAFEIRPKSVPLDTTVTPEESVPLAEIDPPVKQQTLQTNPLPKNPNQVAEEVPVQNIVKQELEPKGPKKNEISLRPMTRSQTQEINLRKSISEDKNASNWLDISHVPIDSVLIVTATRHGFYQDGHATAMAFRAIYDEFGQYKREINAIKHEEGYIRIYVNRQSRLKIKKELEEFNSSFRLEHKLIVNLKNPMIKFEWDQEIHHQNQFEIIERIKKWNRWSGPVTWVISKWSSRCGKFRISLAVSSRIREDIEKENGTISLGRHRVSVIDDFGIIQCFRCSEYGHVTFNCKNYRRCGFCGRGHRSDCKVKEPSKWRCCLCRAQGHSAFSKYCPVLIDYLRPKLEEINHNYNYIFLDNDREC